MNLKALQQFTDQLFDTPSRMALEPMTFNEWCDLHSFNPDNDDNFNLYLVWVERETRNQ